MSSALKTVIVTWTWAGDPFALRGFNVAITPTGVGVHPDTHAVSTGFAGPDASSYEFSKIVLDVGVEYVAWVQAVYIGKDSDWVSQGTLTAADDGTATIPPAHSAATGARWVLEPGQYFRIYDDTDNIIFDATLAGPDIGDVFCGDLAANKGWKWDKSAGTFTIGSNVIFSNTLASTVEAQAAEGSNAWSKFSGVGSTLPAGNVEFNFADSATKGGNALNTDAVGTKTAVEVENAVINFNTRNDRDGTVITAPVVATDGTAVDHTINTDGTADISFEWSWAGVDSDIDGWIVYVRQSSSSLAYTFGTTPAEEKVFYVTADRRAVLIYGVPADKYYTFGVQAYRIVDPDIDASGVITTAIVQPTLAGENPYQPSTTVAFAGDITGTIGGTPAQTVRDNAASGATFTSTDAGALAYIDIADWGSQVGGVGKPDDYANTSSASNLVLNGNAEFGNNLNFDQWAYDTSVQAYTGKGCFSYTGYVPALFSEEFIPVSVHDEFELSCAAAHAVEDRIYLGFACYTEDLVNIAYHQCWRSAAKDTTLYSAYTAGSLTVEIYPAAEAWYDSTVSPWSFIQFDIATDYSDLPNFNTVQIDTIDTSPGTYWILTLKSAVQTSYAAGTAVGNSYAGGSYNYALAVNDISPTNWTYYSALIGGSVNSATSPPPVNLFRRGTAYIRFLCLPCRVATNTVYVDAVSLRKLGTPEINFNNRNDRLSTAVVAPTVAVDGTAVDHVVNTDGSVDISFEWAWSGVEAEIDGFIVFVRRGTTNVAYTIGTTPSEEQVFFIPSDKRSMIFGGFPADGYYTFGVRAYRVVDSDINAAGIMLSSVVQTDAVAGENPYQPSSTVAFTGDITGTVAGTPAATVEANAADGAAAKVKIDTDVGADTIETVTGAADKASTAEANAKAASEPRVTKSATAPTTPAADDLWLDLSVSPHVWKRWDGAAWVKATPTEADEINESATRKWAAESGADVTANNPQDYSWITGTKPPPDATRNIIYRQTTAPTGAVDGDLWFDTDDQLLYRYNGASWEQIGTANVTYSQATAPTGTKGDLWYDTDDNKLYRHDGVGWQQVSTSNDIYSQSTAPTSQKKGDLWYDTSTKKLKRYNGTAWEDIGNDFTATSQLTDDAGLGQTADWPQITGTGKPADNADVTADQMDAGVEITLAGGGIRAGKTGYSDTTAGWFLGRDTDGVPKLRVGGTTYELAWDGTELVIKGKLSVQPGSTGYDNIEDKPPLAQSLWVPVDGELFCFFDHFSSTKGISPL